MNNSTEKVNAAETVNAAHPTGHVNEEFVNRWNTVMESSIGISQVMEFLVINSKRISEKTKRDYREKYLLLDTLMEQALQGNHYAYTILEKTVKRDGNTLSFNLERSDMPIDEILEHYSIDLCGRATEKGLEEQEQN